MPELPSPETKAFLDALNLFMERPPRDLPDGAIDQVKSLSHALKGYTGGDQLSPGEKEAIQVSGGTNEAQPYNKAATGPDAPSPGQKEYEAAIAGARQALDAVGTSPGGIPGE